MNKTLSINSITVENVVVSVNISLDLMNSKNVDILYYENIGSALGWPQVQNQISFTKGIRGKSIKLTTIC